MKVSRLILMVFALAFCFQIAQACAEKVIVDLDKLDPAVAAQIRASEESQHGAVALSPSVASHAESQQGWIDWFKGLNGGSQFAIIAALIILVAIFGAWGLVALGAFDVI